MELYLLVALLALGSITPTMAQLTPCQEEYTACTSDATCVPAYSEWAAGQGGVQCGDVTSSRAKALCTCLCIQPEDSSVGNCGGSSGGGSSGSGGGGIDNGGGSTSSVDKDNTCAVKTKPSNQNCGSYNSGLECTTGGVKVYYRSQNSKHTEQAFLYYGVPIIDTIVGLAIFVFVCLRTKAIGTDVTFARASMVFLSVVMSLIGKSVVFTIAQEYGLILEYIPLLGITVFATRPSAPMLAIYSIVLIFLLTPGIGTVSAAFNSLTSGAAFRQRTWADFDSTATTTCSQSTKFGCFCNEGTPPEGSSVPEDAPFWFTERLGYQNQQWVQLNIVLIVSYGFAAIFQALVALLTLAEISQSSGAGTAKYGGSYA